jgi:glycosyltransferase involved in cell wall biosynthesis
MEPVLSRDQARADLRIDGDAPLVVYTGRVGGDKGLEEVLDVARQCPQVRFLLVGATNRDPFEDEARSVPNVELVPWKSYDELSTWLYAADVLLVPPSEAPLKRKGHTVLPIKLFIYLASGRPILAGTTPDVMELLVDGENAALVPTGDPKGAASSLKRLLEDGALRHSLSEGALRTAQGLTWDARATRIHDFILERASS